MAHPIAEKLRNSDPEVRLKACREAPSDPSAVLLLSDLGAALGDPVRSVARAASDALVELGGRFGEVDEVLRNALRSDEPARRFGAAFTTARLAPPGPRLLPALVEALDSPHGDVRWSAAKLLVDTGRLAGDVLPLLLGLARGDAAPRVRRMATHCLRELAPERPEAARVLLSGTRDSDPILRRASLSALAAVLDPTPEVLEGLRAAAREDGDAACRHIAAAALDALGARP